LTGFGTASAADISYIYDELGRLRAVVDPASDTAVYSYDAVGNLLSISRQASSTVSIIEFNPKSGPIGTTVTIFGAGFSTTPSQNTVTFNGATATVSSSTANQIVATVPPGATTGAIGVTSPAGSASSGSNFTVTSSTGAPTITGFTPTVGTPGTAVTVNGTNFETVVANNVVKFNITRAAVSSAGTTTIQTSVPFKTGSGRISETTPLGTAVSSGDFFIPPSPYTAGNVDLTATGRMSIGQTTTVTIGTANKIGMIVFDGTAGQRISLQTSNVTIPGFTDLTLQRPDGTTLASLVGVPTFNFLDATTLPLTGTYTIVIDPRTSTATGNITLTLHNVPPDITGPITPGGSPVTVATTTPGQNAKLTFSGTAGQRVSLLVSNSTYPNQPSSWAAGVSILKPDQTLLASTTYTGGGTFIDVQALPVSGTYTVLLDPNRTGTGQATLTLYDVPADITGTITSGSPTTVNVTTPGQNVKLTFTGSAGERMSATATNFSMSACWPRLSILKPDGAELVGVDGNCASANIFIEPTTLPTTGTYTLMFNPPKSTTGQVTLGLHNVVDVTGTITPGSPQNVTVTTPGQDVRLTFTGTAGERMSTLSNNSTITGCWPRLSILKPDGSELVGADGNCAAGNIYIEPATLPVNGTYTLRFNPPGPSTGQVILAVYSVVDVTGTITINGSAENVTVTTPGQNVKLTFSGTASQSVSALSTNSTITGCWPRLSILRPDGSELVGVSGNCAAGNISIGSTSLPVTGTYTLMFNPPGASTGQVTLDLNSP
jgi:YD repeat-containing protein